MDDLDRLKGWQVILVILISIWLVVILTHNTRNPNIIHTDYCLELEHQMEEGTKEFDEYYIECIQPSRKERKKLFNSTKVVYKY